MPLASSARIGGSGPPQRRTEAVPSPLLARRVIQGPGGGNKTLTSPVRSIHSGQPLETRAISPYTSGQALDTLARVFAITYAIGYSRDLSPVLPTCLAIHDAVVRASPDNITVNLKETLFGGVGIPGGGGGGGAGPRGGGASLPSRRSITAGPGGPPTGTLARRGGASSSISRGGGGGGSTLSTMKRGSGGGGSSSTGIVVTFPIATAVFQGTRLHVACARGNAQRVSHLLSLGCSPETRDTNHATPLLSLLRALRDGLIPRDRALDTLYTLLRGGADPGAVYTGGFNLGEGAYHTAFACEDGGEIASMLVQAGGGRGLAAVAARGGSTPLHCALRGGREEPLVEPHRAITLLPLIQAMLDAGAGGGGGRRGGGRPSTISSLSSTAITTATRGRGGVQWQQQQRLDPNAVMEEVVGTGGRVVKKRPLDVLIQRLLDAPVSVPGWPYTGVPEWREVADCLIQGGASPSECLEETRVWLRKAGL